MRSLAALLAAAALIAAGLLAWSSCSAKATPAWPEGTVLAVDDLPISAADVDRESVYVERIAPESSPAQLRRLALTNIVLPRAVSRLMDPEARERVRAEAEATFERVKSGKLVGPTSPDGGFGQRASGGWGELGIVVWGVAMDLEDGQWSGLIEDAGRYVILRCIKRTDGPLPIAATVEIDLLSFPWLPLDGLRDAVDRAHDEHRLTIVDPAWKAIVPEQIQYRMGAR